MHCFFPIHTLSRYVIFLPLCHSTQSLPAKEKLRNQTYSLSKNLLLYISRSFPLSWTGWFSSPSLLTMEKTHMLSRVTVKVQLRKIKGFKIRTLKVQKNENVLFLKSYYLGLI